MRKSLLLLSIIAMAASSSSIKAGIPKGYYDSLEGKCGVQLKEAVKQIISDHVYIEYGNADPDNTFKPVEVATWTVFESSDVRDINGYSCWWDMYSANNVRVQDGHPGLNIEHSVANSWWGGKSGSSLAYCDLHHLNPSNSDANGQKSNWPLGEIQGNAYWTNGVTTTGTPKPGQGGGATRVFEPYWSYKGDFARAYFYIFTLYDDIPWKSDYAWMYNVASNLTLQQWAYDLLLAWAENDVVSQKEIERNEAVYTFQKNRNPFIDCPQLAQHIWGSKKNEPFHFEIYTPPVAEDEIYPGWDEAPVEMTVGQWVPLTSASDIKENCEYFIVSPDANRAMTYTLVEKKNAIAECAYGPLHELKTYPEVLTAVPQDIATVKLEKGTGDYWYIAVYSPDNKFTGYISVSTNNSAKFSSTKTDDCRVKISIDTKNNTVITFDYTDSSNKPFTLQYNAGNPRFAAYMSNQKPIQLFRASETLLEDPEEEQNDNTGVGSTGLEENENEIITGIYDINGRLTGATSTEGLDKGIYIVVSNYGTKKILK